MMKNYGGILEKIIEIKELVKRYKGSQVNAVDAISFDVYKGELFSFLGVNGAGKSTTINILSTLLRKTSGSVKVCGYDMETEENSIRNSIGIVFQGSMLDGKLSVKDNLFTRATFYNLSKAATKERIDFLSQRLGMTEYLSKYYGELSGGQRRKCDVARALLAKPQILFLDEPTTGLDPQSRIDLWKTVEQLRKEDGTTVFLTTHYMEEVNASDRVAIIDKGKILCIDSPQLLKNQFSNDKIKLTPILQKVGELEKRLNAQKLEYTRTADTYIVTSKNALDCIEFISSVKSILVAAEISKGDMDSVFITVVGRTFANE